MMGRHVAAHCHGTGGIRNCMLGGVDTIEHGTYLDDETADMMVANGAQLVLTLGAGNPDLESYPLSPVQQADAERRKTHDRAGASSRFARPSPWLVPKASSWASVPMPAAIRWRRINSLWRASWNCW